MIAWVDIETTGLDERDGLLLEIAVLATDDQLERVIEGPNLVISYQPHLADFVEYMHPVVVEMHTKSGLFEALRHPDFCTPLEEAERRCRDFFLAAAANRFNELEGRTPGTIAPEEVLRRTPLAGSSVHFDRRWLRHHMPRLETLFSHRIVDVSTINECAKRWAPLLHEARPKDDKAHRALADVKHSLATLRHYQRCVFYEAA